MKPASLIFPLAAIVAGGLILRRKQKGVGATRQLQIDFGRDFYEPTVDLWAERQAARPRATEAEVEEARRSAGKAYEDMQRYYHGNNAYWGRNYKRDMFVDARTGDEYALTDVYQIYGRPVASQNEPHLMHTIEGEDLRDLSLTVEQFQNKAKRFGWELWLYQNGELAEYLG